MGNPYMNAPIRARMYDQPWHRWVWVALLVVSFGLLVPPFFFIAWRKRVVPLLAPVLYAVFAWGTPVMASLIGNGKNWSGAVMSFTMIIGAVHAAIVDKDWK